MPLYRAELLAKKPLWHGALIHDVSQVLYLPFDWDDGSYARDRSGYNNHGTIYGATKTAGKIGMARSFDGLDDYAKVNYAPSLNITDYLTVTCWMKRTGSKTGYEQIVNKYYVNQEWQIGLVTDTKQIYFQTTSSAYRISTTTAPAINEWKHIVATFEYGGTAKLYVDGSLVASSTTWPNTLPSGANPIGIGAFAPIPLEHFYGIIDEVHVYNRTLSADEARMLMYRRL